MNTKRKNIVAGALACCALVALAAPAYAQEDDAVELKVGDKAPDFELVGSDGETYSLGQFKGEKPVILAFFPKAFTGG